MAHPEFILLGDAVWLDLVNSARGRTPHPLDLIPDAEAYSRWAKAQHLDAGVDPVPFDFVRRFREQLTALAKTLHDGLQPPTAAITAINEQLARGTGSHRLTRVGGEWRLHFAPSRQPGALEIIARSAAATLADPRVFVRRCAGEHCSLFFTDDTPNQSRRWCSSQACGANGRVERRRGLLR
ncbi:MAG: CGNR zinc finger domain-containing protein [Gemmatimonadales bacterium]